jgi:very-short-patch-repair endonuclease
VIEKKKSLVPTTRRLIEFLRDLALMKDKIVRDISSYEDVQFLNSLPPELSKNLNIEAGDGEVLLTVKPIKTIPAPPPPDSLSPFVKLEEVSISSISSPPFLNTTPQSVLSSIDATKWVADWNRWAAADRLLEPQRFWYKLLAKFQRRLDVQSDEYEVVLGIGMMSVLANNFVTRHPLMTFSLVVQADPINGELKVILAEETKVRLSDRRLLEGYEFFDTKRQADWYQKVREWDPVPLGSDASQLLREWLTGISRAFPFDESWEPTERVDDSLRLVLAPCLILRERDRSNLVEYFERMLESLQGEDAVAPLGLAQLISAIEAKERLQWLEEDDATSADVLGADPLFPLPANPEQLEIIQKLSRDSGVVVQGPPGTGKTHTIANLVSALLSQGQRVLVTSQKAQALRVLREKMPDDVQALCISMTDVARGGSKELNQSVTSLSDKFNHFSADIHKQRVKTLQDRRHSTRGLISKLKEEIRLSREKEMEIHTYISDGYSGKRSEVAEKVRELQERFDWFPLPLAPDAPQESSLNTSELQELLSLLRQETPTRVARARQVLPKMDSLPSPAVFEELSAKETRAKEVAKSEKTSWSILFEKIARAQRDVLLASLNESHLLLAKFDTRKEQQWLIQALNDSFNQVSLKLWRQVASDLSVMAEVQTQISKLGLTQVQCPDLPLGEENGLSVRLQQVKELHSYLLDGGSFKKGPLKSGAERKVKEFLKLCQVNGVQIRDIDSVEKLLTHLSADVLTRQVLERLKDVGVSYSEQSRLVPRVHELTEIQECIANLVKLGSLIEDVTSLLLSKGITVRPKSREELAESIRGLEACELLDDFGAVELELKKLNESVGLLAKKPNSAPELVELERALGKRDVERYKEEFFKLASSFAEKDEQNRCEELFARLRNAHGPLAELLRATKSDGQWLSRISTMSDAWSWAIATRFLDSYNNLVPEGVAQDKLRSAIDDLGDATGKLAAELGWGKCLNMMTAEQERALRTYQSNISSKGKGQGKWAGRYARAARQAMSQAREAVPAWIMPLNEVLDTIPPDQNSFDVVIVDEASQAGIEALFLLWLAPRIIVVGDERQCAPSTIVRGGLQQIFDRLDEFLKDVPEYLRLEFTPKSNLFSLLSTRYGSIIRLREHFRCMPEIIGWSSTQFYSDAPLIPLRQFGSDRLPPLRTTRVEGAFTDGSSSTLTNKVEALEIVRQIQKCLIDPAYKDKTMGVIVLQSAAQARLIDDLLAQSISQEEMTRRRIRVGIAPDFQGDERNVIFLSMVVAEGEKIVAMTQRDWQRRFNVAATRAEDQMWLFHSVSLSSLKPQDLRKSLLGYVMSPPQVFGGVEHEDLQWNSEKRAPFGSKFEQRVFLKIRDRGYFVKPQVEVNGRFIDLVVTGAKGQLAVECDGDFWHSSAEDQMADIDRQVELERAGWRFVRIRESTFNRNPDAAMEPLWYELERRGIRPGDLRHADNASAPDWVPVSVIEEEGLDGIEDLELVSNSAPIDSKLEQLSRLG